VSSLLLVAGNALLLVTGQFLWKLGLQTRPNPFADVSAIVSTLVSPYILAGIAIYGGATVLWLYILSRVPLSVAYPLQSMAYLVAIVAAHFVFGEDLTAGKLVGAVLIMAGITFVAFSGGGS